MYFGHKQVLTIFNHTKQGNFQNFCSFITKLDLQKISDVYGRNCNYFNLDAVKV